MGGWTKRESFASAYSESVLKKRLEAYLPDDRTILENATYEGVDIPPHVDVVWIANPAGQPDDGDISILQRWLQGDVGNKKLIITYSGTDKDTRQIIAENVNVLCDKLGISSRPFKRPCKGDYYVQGSPIDTTEKVSLQVLVSVISPVNPFTETPVKVAGDIVFIPV